ncbi:MAG: glycosyltransferase family 10 [Bacteroidota bacterium]|nr:glycosyltransferase family 10 [Bacteroidota bacterium]
MKKLSAFLRMHYEYRKEVNRSANSQLKFHNLWPYDQSQNLWFYRFIQYRAILENSKEKEIALFSVFGHRDKLAKNKSDIQVFFTGENVQRKIFSQYKDHCLKDVDLSMGFEFIQAENYLRFPLWILYIIDPELNLAGVKKKLNEISAIGRKIPSADKKFCCLVASHDENGIRSKMFSELSKIASVESGGNLLNNTDDLRVKYKNDKVSFLRNYKFNICPENSDILGYVTEKPFEALLAGCIPVYQGSGNMPEPGVLNHNAMLLWNEADNGLSCRKLAEDLQKYDGAYEAFINQDRFAPSAAEFILDHMNDLEKRLVTLLRNS